MFRGKTSVFRTCYFRLHLLFVLPPIKPSSLSRPWPCPSKPVHHCPHPFSHLCSFSREKLYTDEQGRPRDFDCYFATHSLCHDSVYWAVLRSQRSLVPKVTGKPEPPYHRVLTPNCDKISQKSLQLTKGEILWMKTVYFI